jgi:membrane-associated phospholipid phosphatase
MSLILTDSPIKGIVYPMPAKTNKKRVQNTVKEPIKKITKGAHQATLAATASAPVRRHRAMLFLVSLLIISASFAVLTFLVKTTPSFPLDLRITLGIQSINIPGFEELMKAVSWPGFLPQSMILSALIILLIFGLGLQWEALTALIAASVSTGLNVLVKDLIQRPRPAAGLVHVIARLNDYSFPSGHVMFYVGFYGFLGFQAFTLLKPSFKCTLLLFFFSLIVLLVGVSRIYVGEHWASDVLGAYLLGTLTLEGFILLYRWGKPRFFVHQPIAEAETLEV